MASLDFAIFDADNHYYEAEDAFTRHIDPRMAKRAMQWGQVDGRKTLLVGGKLNRFIPNPTFDPVAKPGCLEQYFRGRNPNGLSMRELFGAPGETTRAVATRIFERVNAFLGGENAPDDRTLLLLRRLP